MTSGNARSGQWKLRFEPQSPPFVEPLMGWTGGEDDADRLGAADWRARYCILSGPAAADL